MKLSSTVDQNEVAELSKLINRDKANDIHAYSMAVTQEMLEKGESLKVTRRNVAIGRARIYALRYEQGSITHNMDEIIKNAERFYPRLSTTETT